MRATFFICIFAFAGLVGGCGGDDEGSGSTFACGTETCTTGLQYCKATNTAASTTTYACMDMTGMCRDDVRCECIHDLEPGCTCTEDPEDVLTATCEEASS